MLQEAQDPIVPGEGQGGETPAPAAPAEGGWNPTPAPEVPAAPEGGTPAEGGEGHEDHAEGETHEGDAPAEGGMAG